MARITVEDCLTLQTNRFALIHLASKRTKQLLQGATVVLSEECDNKAVVTSLREIAEGKVRFLTPEEVERLRELNLEEQVPGLEPEAIERRALAQKSLEEEINNSSEGEGLGKLGAIASDENGAKGSGKNGHSHAKIDLADEADDLDDTDDVDDVDDVDDSSEEASDVEGDKSEEALEAGSVESVSGDSAEDVQADDVEPEGVESDGVESKVTPEEGGSSEESSDETTEEDKAPF